MCCQSMLCNDIALADNTWISGLMTRRACRPLFLSLLYTSQCLLFFYKCKQFYSSLQVVEPLYHLPLYLFSPIFRRLICVEFRSFARSFLLMIYILLSNMLSLVLPCGIKLFLVSQINNINLP